MNLGRQSGDAIRGFSCWGMRSRNGLEGDARALQRRRRRAPIQKGERDVVRHPDDRPGLEQLTRRVRHCAAMDEVVDQLHRRPQRAQHEHRYEHDRERAQPARAAVILPGSAAITATSNTPSMNGSSSHCGPNRIVSGSRIVRTIAASTAPAIGQRASPTTSCSARLSASVSADVPLSRSRSGVTPEASSRSHRRR